MSNVTNRLNEIGNSLSRLGQKARRLIQEASGLPSGLSDSPPARYTGSTRRLSDDEEAAIVQMLDAGYSVQFIASEFAVSRPTVYNVRSKHRPDMHHRPSHQAHA